MILLCLSICIADVVPEFVSVLYYLLSVTTVRFPFFPPTYVAYSFP